MPHHVRVVLLAGIVWLSVFLPAARPAEPVAAEAVDVTIPDAVVELERLAPDPLPLKVRREKKHICSGTYAVALNPDGSQVCLAWNGAAVPLKTKHPLGLSAVTIVHIPKEER